MTEENVTKAILKWLISNKWEIICFDFPQSGTGRFLHPNTRLKNKDSINPDIVAVKNNVCVFFENKDRFYYPDYKKVHNLIVNDDYSDAISQLLSKHIVNKIFYGIGLPKIKHSQKSIDSSYLVNFIIGVEEDESVCVLHNSCSVIF